MPAKALTSGKPPSIRAPMAAGAIPPPLFFGQRRPPLKLQMGFMATTFPKDTSSKENQQRRSRGSSGRRAHATKSEQHAKDI
jgi:hypothetical protein